MAKYRIGTTYDVLGKMYYTIESKQNWYSGWKHEHKCFQEKWEEIYALKELLELGGSQYTIFRPSEELKISKEWLRINNKRRFKKI